MKRSPRLAPFIACCALLLAIHPSSAQEFTASIWRELGLGSAGNNGLSNETSGNSGPPSAAIDGANVYVAWESGASEIFVRKWTGTEWAAVGTGSASGGGISNNAGHSRVPSITVGPDHLPVVAWLDDSSGNWEVYLRKFIATTNTWASVAGSAEGAGLSKALGGIAAADGAQPMVAAGGDGKILVAWAKNAVEKHVFVSSGGSTGWTVLGGGTDLSSAEYVVDAAGHAPPQYLGATQPSLVLGTDNAPILGYVTTSDASLGDVHVRRWNGSAWLPLGSGSATNAGISGGGLRSPEGFSLHSLRLAVAPNGVVHASWLYADADHRMISVRQAADSGWVDVGPALAVPHALPLAGAAFGFASDGSAIVGWTASPPEALPAGNTEIYLNRLVTLPGTAGPVWQEFGAGSASGGGVSADPGESAYPFLAFARTNPNTASAPVLVWLDGSDSSVPLAGQVYARQGQPAATTLEFAQAIFTVSEAAGVANISVVRKGVLTGETRVHYSLQDGTATAGSDYTATEGDLVFAANDTVKSFPVAIAKDSVVEPSETVTLTLSSPGAGSDLGALRTASLVITDSPAPPPPVAAGHLQFKSSTWLVDEGRGKAVIEVTRTDGHAGEVSVNFETIASTATSNAPGVATPGADYASVSGSLTFADGVLSRTFEVPILEDTLVEGPESLGLRLSAPAGGATLGSPSTATLTIQDNDVAPPPGAAGRLAFKVTGFVAGEGSGHALIEVSRTDGTAGAVIVDYATVPATGEHPATADADYTPVSGTLHFADGVSSQIFAVPILEDTLVEGPETVGLRLSNPTGGATLGTAVSAQLVIQDNDTVPAGTIQFDPVEYHVARNAGVAQLRVTRSGSAAAAASVEYFTLPVTANKTGTATPGADFEAVSGTLTFAAGQAAGTISVPIKKTNLIQPNESFVVALKSPQGATLGAAATATVVIESAPTSNPGLFAFSATEYRVMENAGVAEIAVLRREGSTGTVSVTYSTSDPATGEHPATADVDYSSTLGVLTFADGETRKIFTVPIIDDSIQESTEALALTLSAPTGGAALASTGATATLLIADDDQPAGTLAFSSAEARLRKGAGSVTLVLTRQQGGAGEVSVQYATTDGTAKAGRDYTATAGTATFAAGQFSRAITIPLRSDSAVAGAQTFTVALSQPTGGALLGAPATATVTILDREPAGVLRFSRADYTASEGGRSVLISVTRSEGLAGAVSVRYATADGTALADADYTAVTGTLVFPAGIASRSFTVPILDDSVPEPLETFSVLLSEAAGGATLGPRNLATVSIVDNDPAPSLQFAQPDFRVSENGERATISVVRRGTADTAVSVNYATSDGTATAGADYTATSGLLEFAKGEKVKRFTIPIARDNLAEGTESVQLTLCEPGGGAILGTPSTATLTIVDPSAAAGSVQFSAARYYVNPAAGLATITVVRKAGSTGAVTVNYAAAAGTAAETENFIPVSGTLNFAAGERTKKFTVPIVTDAVAEAPKTIQLDLTEPTGGALLGTPAHTVLTVVSQAAPGSASGQ